MAMSIVEERGVRILEGAPDKRFMSTTDDAIDRTARAAGQRVDAARAASLSVIIPAYNEARYLPDTLSHLKAAGACLPGSHGADLEILVVDNASSDGTADVARALGARVVQCLDHNVARVRNAGAAAARHDVLVFVDADTLVPVGTLAAIANEMTDAGCAGGAVDAVHLPSSVVLRAYFAVWRVIGLIGGMAQGACQFCRRSVFVQLGGYDETQYMGEDLDFFWRLKRLARRRGLRTTFIREVQVIPSPRRWESWPVWRTLVWTNPVLAFMLRRRRAMWPGWYREPPR